MLQLKTIFTSIIIVSAFNTLSYAEPKAPEYAPPYEQDYDETYADKSPALDYGPSALARYMHEKGFYNIEIDDDRPSHYDVEACYHGKEYELKLSPKWRLLDEDYDGRCKSRKRVYIDTPFASVDVDRDIDIRVPFLDLHIQRRRD